MTARPVADRAWQRVLEAHERQRFRYADFTPVRWNRELVRRLGAYADACALGGERSERCALAVANVASVAVCALEALSVSSLGPIHERIVAERVRQDEKFTYPRPHTWDEWLLVLTEEQGEFAEALNDTRGLADSEPAQFTHAAHKELIQVAAVAVCILTHYEDGHIPCER